MSDKTLFEGMNYADVKASVEAQLGSTPDGWSGLVTDLFEHVKRHCDENGLTYPDVRQIKKNSASLGSTQEPKTRRSRAGSLQHFSVLAAHVRSVETQPPCSS